MRRGREMRGSSRPDLFSMLLRAVFSQDGILLSKLCVAWEVYRWCDSQLAWSWSMMVSYGSWVCTIHFHPERVLKIWLNSVGQHKPCKPSAILSCLLQTYAVRPYQASNWPELERCRLIYFKSSSRSNTGREKAATKTQSCSSSGQTPKICARGVYRMMQCKIAEMAQAVTR